MSEKSPVLFLVFNRYETTIQVFEMIKKEQPKKLYIAADGPRENQKEDINKCKKVREIFSSIDWDCEVKTLYQKNNLGPMKSQINAINWFFDNESEGIILEDDALVELNFKIIIRLALMNIDDFDILYLSLNLNKEEDAELINPFILKVLKGMTTTGYIVKIKNIQNILDVIENSEAEIDNAYSESNLRKYCVNPMVIFQKNFESDINNKEIDYGFYHEKFKYQS